jgi:hypothetical protein
MFSLGAVAVVLAGGVALDFSRSAYEDMRLQGVLDAALLAGVSSSIQGEKQVEAAQKYFAANAGLPAGAYTVSFTNNKTQLTGTASRQLNTTLMRVGGIDTVDVQVKGLATANISYEPLCFGSMHPTRKHTLELHDSVSVYGPNCNFYGNSNHHDDVVDPHTDENFMTGKFIGAIGGGHNYLANVTPQVEFGTEVIEDPLRNWSAPAPGPCKANGVSLSGGVHDLPPGHYCGGLTITGGAEVRFGNGNYSVSGLLKVQSAKLTSNGSTIFLNGSAKIEWDDADIKLAAPKTGSYAGVALFADPVPTDNAITKSRVDVHGAFYMPKGAFIWENEGNFVPSGKWGAFILDGVSWIGSGTVTYAFDLKGSDIPYPEELISVPRPGQPRLLK